MAIHVKKPRKKLTSEINMVPLIDVMLVLLVVFMITAPLLTQGVKVELPDANSAPLDEQEQKPLVVFIKADGSYWFELGNDGQQREKLPVIKERVGKILRQQPKTPVLVWGDTKVEYGVVVHLMTELQNAGATSVGLVTEPAQN